MHLQVDPPAQPCVLFMIAVVVCMGICKPDCGEYVC